MQGTALLTDTVPAHWRFAFSPDTHSLLKPLLYVDMHVHACPVAKSSSTLCDPWDHSPPDSSVHGIFQARILEWVAIFFSRGYSRPRGLNLHLLLWQVDSSPLSHLGSPLGKYPVTNSWASLVAQRVKNPLDNLIYFYPCYYRKE